MTKFNTLPQHTWVPDKGPYISCDSPNISAERSQAELNWQGQYPWREREKKGSTLKT